MAVARHDFAGKVLGGFMLITVLLTAVTCGARAVGDVVNPEGAAQRRAAQQAELDTIEAEARLRVQRANAEGLEKRRVTEDRREERLAAEAAADQAALERYAECQIRNRTPGYCTEDWRPTETIRATNEIARDGQF